MCRLPVYVCGYNCQHEFNVFPKDTTDTQIILGQPWQRTFECTLKWSKNAARINDKAQKILTPFTNTDTTSSTSNKDKEITHEDSPLLNKDLTQEIRPHLISQTKLYLTTQPKKAITNKVVWISKPLLQAQASQEKVWIPKSLLIPTMSPRSRRGDGSKPSPQPQPYTSLHYKQTIHQRGKLPNHQSTQIWIPKLILQAQSNQKCIWVPKT